MGGLANFKLKTWRGKICKNTHRTRTEFDHCATMVLDVYMDIIEFMYEFGIQMTVLLVISRGTCTA